MRLADHISGARQSVRTKQKKNLAVAGTRICFGRHGIATSPPGPLVVVFLRSRVSLDEQCLGVANVAELP